MFTGRDADVADEDRRARRYTLADLAQDLKTAVRRRSNGSRCAIGSQCLPTACSGICSTPDPNSPVEACPPTCTRTRPFSASAGKSASGQVVPISSFLNVDRLLTDLVQITDNATGPGSIEVQLALSILRNFDQEAARRILGWRLGGLLQAAPPEIQKRQCRLVGQGQR